MEYLQDQPHTLPALVYYMAVRLAAENVPVNVVARGLSIPADEVREALDYALETGDITEMPAPDWPPTARRADHLPPAVAAARDTDLMISCMRAFKVTKLMASFMMVLLKREEADKAVLHRVIEAQRASRTSRPDSTEETDPKMVDVVICNLRKKLKPYGLRIETLWGHGYYIDAAGRKAALSLVEQEVQVRNDANAADTARA
jgi:hypothetical protein